MIWVRDATRRFKERPHYEPEELDAECEAAIEEVLAKRHSKIEYPVSTDDLFFMLEQISCLDAYADFDKAQGDVWGESEFLPGQQPRVRISRQLSENNRYENPLRTTITHEYTHVRYHGPLFEQHRLQASLYDQGAYKTWVCKREHVEGHGTRDWMEWQAGYCSGAILVPKRALRGVATAFFKSHDLFAPKVERNTLEEIELVSSVVQSFAVSRHAAAVRLRQLGYITEGGIGQCIFDA